MSNTVLGWFLLLVGVLACSGPTATRPRQTGMGGSSTGGTARSSENSGGRQVAGGNASSHGGTEDARAGSSGTNSSAGSSGSGIAGGAGVNSSGGTGGSGGEPSPTRMLVGGDITYRDLLVDLGAQFADSNGQTSEVLAILQAHSFNLARVRIYNHPGEPTQFQDKTYRLQQGYQDLSDALRVSELAKQHGMKLFVSLHYSDFWTNPGQYAIPASWKDLSFQELLDAVYQFTFEVMDSFRQRGLTPEFIALGNEVNTAIMGYRSDGDQYYEILKRGAQAVKAVSPSTRIVLHLTNPLDRDTYISIVDHAKRSGFEYDLLGVSMYPFWTGWSIEQMVDFTVWASEQSRKDVMICEVGVLYTGTAPGSFSAMGGESFPVSPVGQRDYLRKYFHAMRDSGVVVGIAYWDPIWIDWPGAGWVQGEGNTEWDSALFDGHGRALVGLDAFSTY